MNLKQGCAAALAAIALHGCDRTETVSGEYKLIGSVNSGLPVLLQYDGDCAVNLESGTLTFRADKYDSGFRIVRDCPAAGDSIMPDPGAHGGTFELHGDTLKFLNDTGNFAGIGIRKGDTLTITGTQHTLVYTRD